MAKYRSLSTEELNIFEKEFINYLVVNGITAEDWVIMKKNEMNKAEQIVDLFSDVIFEGVMRKANYLMLKTKTYIQVIYCLADKMELIAVNAKDSSFDMSHFTPDLLIEGNFDIHKGEKIYIKNREIELFELTEKGYEIEGEDFYKSLGLILLDK